MACISILQSIIEGSQGRNLEAGSEVETMEVASSLAPHDLFNLPSDTTQYPRVALPAMVWALLHQELVKSMPHRLVYSLMEAYSQFRFTLSRCVKLTKQQNNSQYII